MGPTLLGDAAWGRWQGQGWGPCQSQRVGASSCPVDTRFFPVQASALRRWEQPGQCSPAEIRRAWAAHPDGTAGQAGQEASSVGPQRPCSPHGTEGNTGIREAGNRPTDTQQSWNLNSDSNLCTRVACTLSILISPHKHLRGSLIFSFIDEKQRLLKLPQRPETGQRQNSCWVLGVLFPEHHIAA